MNFSALSQNLPVVVITGVFLLITVVLLGVIAWQAQEIRRRIAENTKVRTGFLGKPIAAVLVVGLLAGGFGITYLTNQTTLQINDVSVSDSVSFNINTFNNRLDDRKTQVIFNLVPTVNGTQWGADDPTSEFDVFWTIKGEDSFSQVELGLNQNKVGGFSRTMTNGYYSITAEVYYAGSNWTVTKELRL